MQDCCEVLYEIDLFELDLGQLVFLDLEGLLNELLFVDEICRVHQKIDSQLLLLVFNITEVNLENVFEAKLPSVRFKVLVLARSHRLVDEVLELLIVERAFTANAVRSI